MEFMNKDFNAVKPRQYEEIRREMARIYSSIDIKMFGPESVTVKLSEVGGECAREETLELIKEEQQLIKCGYNCVMEKIKKIRQSFSSAVISGRSGLSKVVIKHYNALMGIFGVHH